MGVEVTRLANGVTVATHAMPHLESVALGVWINTGGRSEAPGEHGISHLLEHMAFKGTERRDARAIAEVIEEVGGEMNAETSVDHTSYYVRILKEDVELGLDVLGDILCHSAFDPAELGREQHVIIQEIGAALDTPEDWVFELFQESAYPDQAIGRSILGTPASIGAQTPDDLRRFLAAHYRGPETVITAAGNLDHAAIVAGAETHFASLSPEKSPKTEPGFYRGGEILQARPLQEAQILLGFEAPGYHDDTLQAAHILSSIVGGGMASRLFQEAREERGLCYSIYSFFWPFADTGIFGVHAATSEEDVDELTKVVADELHKMTDGVSETELKRAKAQLRAGLMMGLESPLARAGQLARHILIYGRPLSFEELVARIESVDARMISDLAAKILSSAPTLAAIGPVGNLPSAGDMARRIAGANGAGAR